VYAGSTKDDWNASQLGLVLEEAAELIKSPVRKSWTLSARGRCPRANVLEILKRNRPVGAFRLFHDGFGDAVVDVALVAGLSARDGAELPRSRSALLALEIASPMGEDASNLLDHLAGVAIPVGVICNVDNAQVDADGVDDLDGWGLIDVAGNDDVEVSTSRLEIDLALATDEHLTLILPANKGNPDAAIDRPDGDGVIVADAKDAVVEGLGSCLPEGVLVLLVAPVAGRDLPDAES